jgi:hypothetical protein
VEYETRNMKTRQEYQWQCRSSAWAQFRRDEWEREADLHAFLTLEADKVIRFSRWYCYILWEISRAVPVGQEAREVLVLIPPVLRTELQSNNNNNSLVHIFHVILRFHLFLPRLRLGHFIISREHFEHDSGTTDERSYRPQMESR